MRDPGISPALGNPPLVYSRRPFHSSPYRYGNFFPGNATPIAPCRLYPWPRMALRLATGRYGPRWHPDPHPFLESLR